MPQSNHLGVKYLYHIYPQQATHFERSFMSISQTPQDKLMLGPSDTALRGHNRSSQMMCH